MSFSIDFGFIENLLQIIRNWYCISAYCLLTDFGLYNINKSKLNQIIYSLSKTLSDETVPLYLQCSVWTPVTFSKNDVIPSLTYVLASIFYALSTVLICFTVRSQEEALFCFHKYIARGHRMWLFLRAIKLQRYPLQLHVQMYQ